MGLDAEGDVAATTAMAEAARIDEGATRDVVETAVQEAAALPGRGFQLLEDPGDVACLRGPGFARSEGGVLVGVAEAPRRVGSEPLDVEDRGLADRRGPRPEDLENVTQNVYRQAGELPAVLASVLRRKPDVLLVDRCPDEETARLVLDAATEQPILLGLHGGDTFIT
ncbi:hypothetical protein LCGC14_1256790, partial [marine sediment metagenome]